MKVLNLQCAHQHVFEGWFASEADYSNQLAQGLLLCPLCGDAQVQKMLSAPRLNLGRNEGKQQSGVEGAEQQGLEQGNLATPDRADHHQPTQEHVTANRQGQLLRALRELVGQSQDVGERFAHEARAMHQGESPQRSIRGQATEQEVEQLLEDGIEVLALPHLPVLKETLQ